MFGLSATAIGLRSTLQATQIFQALQQPLQLEFYELAVGIVNTADAVYPPVPLVLHDNCLYRRNSSGKPSSQRLKIRQNSSLSLPDAEDLQGYLDFIDRHTVQSVHVHAHCRKNSSLKEQEQYLQQLQSLLPVPVYVEVMPFPSFWASDLSSMPDWPLLVDVSHVKIWYGGNAEKTCETVLYLLEHYTVGHLHLSDNDGKEDSHDLVSADAWFMPYLPEWTQRYPCTWESLPVNYKQYERLDKQKRGKQHG